MVKHNQAGFSLVELVLVMAISSAMVAVAFMGQRGLRSRAQFDASVDKVVASVADAHNQALAAVNTVGMGNGLTTCGGGGGPFVFAGVAWSADDALGNNGRVKYDFYETDSNAQTCIFSTQTLDAPAALRVNASNPPSTRGARILFVRGSTGALSVCPVTNLSTDVRPMFSAGSCASGSVTLTFTDNDGHSSQVLIDPSGLAKRLN